AAEASEKDRSVGPAPLLGAGDATGSLGETSCIADIAPSGCGVEAALGGLSCSSSAIIRRMEARISSIEGSSFLAGCVMAFPLTPAEVVSPAATSAESARCAEAGEL